ncbi:MAG: MBL fold metallo-hydrolase, partial [Thermoplasmata archaeon]
MSEDIKAVFLGGGSEVGKLGLVLEIEDIRLLLDYGISPTKPPSYPMDAPPVDLTLLTHAHLDHCGMLPYLVREQDVPIWTTDLTREVSNILHVDSLKVAKVEGYAYPYDKIDVKEAYHRVIPIKPF